MPINNWTINLVLGIVLTIIGGGGFWIFKRSIEDAALSEAKVVELQKELQQQEEYINEFFAPAVAESPLQIGLTLENSVNIEPNDTKLIIAKVQWINLKKELIAEDGNLDFSLIDAVNVVGLENYYGLEFLAHRPYAKVK